MPEHQPPPIEQKLSLEKWLATEFSQCYDTQIKILNRLGLLEILPESGEKGIRGIDGKEYPLPSKEAVIEEMRRNRERYEPKLKQGFTQIQLTPFGLPLELLAAKLEERILAHHKAGKLFATKENPADPDQPLDLDTNQPLFSWEGWIDKNAPLGEQGADVSGKCVYHPTSFDQTNHGGKTKQQILDAPSTFPGWEVKLLEKSPNIPREGKGKTKGGRKQLEANQTPQQYLTELQTNPTYQNEEGLTNEDWIAKFLIHLETTNEVIDDYGGKGSACYLPGSYNPASRYLGYGCWDRYDRRANLGRNGPGNRNSDRGLRSAVGLGH